MSVRIIPAVLVLISLSGCVTNQYDEYYIAVEGTSGMKSVHGEAPVELKLATGENDVLDLLENGYVASGRSAFSGPYTPMSLAVDAARSRSDALVLMDVRFKEIRKSTSVMYMPSYTTTCTYGTVFGRRMRSYSGTHTTTTFNPVTVQNDVAIYEHDAMFFKKVDTSGSYGVHWQIPVRAPGEALDAPIEVRILAVNRNSPAERDGLRRGQKVKSVNRVAIRTRRDIAAFLEPGAVIEKVEVSDEK